MDFKFKKTLIQIIKDDITKIKADAMVNAANTTLLGGGGVDGAIHKAAGPELLQECKTLGGCQTGQAKITKGHMLPAKFVIHTVGPIWKAGYTKENELLSSCYINSFKLAQQYSLKTIAFPAISTGAYGFPIKEASEIALETTKSFIKENPHAFEKIIFVLFSDDIYKVYLHLYNTIFSND